MIRLCRQRTITKKDVFNGDIGKIVDMGPLYEDDEK